MKTWATKLNGAEFKITRLQETFVQVEYPVLDSPESSISWLMQRVPQAFRFNTDTENMIAVPVNTRARPIGFEIVTNGTLDTLMIHAREIFRPALILGASAIILAHNHPSGDPTPSEADIKVTRDLIRAGQLLKVEILDHLIIGNATPERSKFWTSLRELGYFYS